MPRKTAHLLDGLLHLRRFNEAAARCRGKRFPLRGSHVLQVVASMRPRPDAAENLRDGKDCFWVKPALQ